MAVMAALHLHEEAEPDHLLLMWAHTVKQTAAGCMQGSMGIF